MDIRYDDDNDASNTKTKQRKEHEIEIEGLIVKFPFQPYDNVQKTFHTAFHANPEILNF